MGVQVGYTISDIISKCGVGFLVYRIVSPRAKRSAGAQKVKGSAQEVRAPWSWSHRMRHSPNPLIPRPREWACLIHDHGSHMKARAIMPRGPRPASPAAYECYR